MISHSKKLLGFRHTHDAACEFRVLGAESWFPVPVLRSPWAPHSTLGSHGGRGSHEGLPTGLSPELTWALVHTAWPVRMRLWKQQDPEAGRARVGVDVSDSLQRKEKARCTAPRS